MNPIDGFTNWTRSVAMRIAWNIPVDAELRKLVAKHIGLALCYLTGAERYIVKIEDGSAEL